MNISHNVQHAGRIQLDKASKPNPQITDPHFHHQLINSQNYTTKLHCSHRTNTFFTFKFWVNFNSTTSIEVWVLFSCLLPSQTRLSSCLLLASFSHFSLIYTGVSKSVSQQLSGEWWQTHNRSQADILCHTLFCKSVRIPASQETRHRKENEIAITSTHWFRHHGL